MAGVWCRNTNAECRTVQTRNAECGRCGRTGELRSQAAFSAKTLRAADLLPTAGVGSAVTARCGALRAAKAPLARLSSPSPSWGFRPRFRRPLRDAWLNFDEFPGALPLANLRCPGGTFDCGRCARPPWNAEAGTAQMRNPGCGYRDAKRGFWNMLWLRVLSNV